MSPCYFFARSPLPSMAPRAPRPTFAQLHHIGIIAAEFSNRAERPCSPLCRAVNLSAGDEASQHGLYAGKGYFPGARKRRISCRQRFSVAGIWRAPFEVERRFVAELSGTCSGAPISSPRPGRWSRSRQDPFEPRRSRGRSRSSTSSRSNLVASPMDGPYLVMD